MNVNRRCVDFHLQCLRWRRLINFCDLTKFFVLYKAKFRIDRLFVILDICRRVSDDCFMTDRWARHCEVDALACRHCRISCRVDNYLCSLMSHDKFRFNLTQMWPSSQLQSICRFDVFCLFKTLLLFSFLLKMILLRRDRSLNSKSIEVCFLSM